jgi:hypothetical protein
MNKLLFVAFLVVSCGQSAKIQPLPLRIDSAILREHDSAVSHETAGVDPMPVICQPQSFGLTICRSDRPIWGERASSERPDSVTLFFDYKTVAVASGRHIHFAQPHLWRKFLQLRAWNKNHCSDHLKETL